MPFFHELDVTRSPVTKWGCPESAVPQEDVALQVDGPAASCWWPRWTTRSRYYNSTSHDATLTPTGRAEALQAPPTGRPAIGEVISRQRCASDT